MDEAGTVDVVLQFLQKNGFLRAEAAFRSELRNRLYVYGYSDINGFQKLTFNAKDTGKKVEEVNVERVNINNKESMSCCNVEASKELIVKEIERGTVRIGTGGKQKTADDGASRAIEKSFSFSKGSEDTVLDLCSWKFQQSNGQGDFSQNSVKTMNTTYIEVQNSGQTKFNMAEVVEKDKVDLKSTEGTIFITEKLPSWLTSSGKVNIVQNDYRSNRIELEDVDHQKKNNTLKSRDGFTEDLWSKNEAASKSSLEQRTECLVKTVLPFSSKEVPINHDSATSSSGKTEETRKSGMGDVRASIKEQVDEVGRSLYLGKLEGICDEKYFNNLDLALVSRSHKEELPRLPPVRLKSENQSLSANFVESLDHDGPCLKFSSADNTFLIGSYLDVPVGQEISFAGKKTSK